MKRTTVLKANRSDGAIALTVETDSKREPLTRDEANTSHDRLVEGVFKAMLDNGCYAHKIRVR